MKKKGYNWTWNDNNSAPEWCVKCARRICRLEDIGGLGNPSVKAQTITSIARIIDDEWHSAVKQIMEKI